MKQIKLTQDKIALVDDEDYENLCNLKWCAHKERNTFYALRGNVIDGKNKITRMHRAILNAPPGMQVDHINGDGLDNRKSNLRICTIAENLRNRGANSNNTSGYKGVWWSSYHKQWVAEIRIDRKKQYLGRYNSPELAHAAYCSAAIDFHGKFARI